MIDDYSKKDMKPTEMEAPKPSTMAKPESMEDGMIFEKNKMWFFKWKGGECRYMTKELAEIGLEKVSGNS